MNKHGFFINQGERLLDEALLSQGDAWTLIDVNPEYLPVARRIRAARPNALILIRYYYQNPISLDTVNPTWHALKHFNERFKEHRAITNMVMPLNEPQLEVSGVKPDDYESVIAMWRTLNDWVCEWIDTFRALAPDAFIVWPAPAPGVFWDDAGIRGAEDGISICLPNIRRCDAVGINAYWSYGGSGLYTGWEWYAGRYLKTAARVQKPVWISECNGDIHSPTWREEMVTFWKRAQAETSVLGATCFLLEGLGQFVNHDVSTRPNVHEDMVYFSQQLSREEPMDLLGTLRKAAWSAKGIPYNPDFALAKKARELGLGAPETQEFDLTWGGVPFRAQGFVKGVLYCKVGDWGNIRELVSW